MKFKYTGPQNEITLRHVTFKAGEAVELDTSDKRDADLAEKISALDFFEEVKKRGRPKKGVEADGDLDQ